MGLVVEEVKPFGLAGSGGSTPLRVVVKGDPPTFLFAKLYARSHLRADRWYKLGRELLYGRLEDEKPFNTVRRLVQQEDYALRVMRDAGLPSPTPYGFVELTPDREYLLVTEFFDGATELGEAEVDDRVIDDGLGIVRRLWHAGLAHRDVKPANLLVRDGRLLLIDVAFVEARPSPWRQAVDLANMMLCLALGSSAERVYRRALRQFSVEEVGEGFAALAGWRCPRSCAACSAPRVATCTPGSPGCCPPHPSRSGSSGGAPAGSACGRRSCSCSSWSPRTRAPCSATSGPSRSRLASTRWTAGIWNRCGSRPSRCPVGVAGALHTVPAGRLDGGRGGRQRRPVGGDSQPRSGRQQRGRAAPCGRLRPGRRGPDAVPGAGGPPLPAGRAGHRRVRGNLV